MDPTIAAPATMTFTVPAGVTELTPYEWCNLHGFWKGETMSVPTATEQSSASESVADGGAECSLSQFSEGARPSVNADFIRQQKIFFGSDVPFTESDGECGGIVQRSIRCSNLLL